MARIPSVSQDGFEPAEEFFEEFQNTVADFETNENLSTPDLVTQLVGLLEEEGREPRERGKRPKGNVDAKALSRKLASFVLDAFFGRRGVLTSWNDLEEGSNENLPPPGHFERAKQSSAYKELSNELAATLARMITEKDVPVLLLGNYSIPEENLGYFAAFEARVRSLAASRKLRPNDLASFTSRFVEESFEGTIGEILDVPLVYALARMCLSRQTYRPRAHPSETDEQPEPHSPTRPW